MQDQQEVTKEEVKEEPIYKVEFIDSVQTPLNVAEAAVQEIAETKEEETPVVETVEEKEEDDLDDNILFKHLGKKLGKEVTSLEDLIVEKVVEKETELPEDVSAFYKFKKETGRGLDDFVKLSKDYDNIDETTLLQEYYKSTNEGLDTEDIDTMLSEFSYDEDIDEEKEISKKKLAKKRALNEAKKYFNQLKETYKVPLESSMASLSEEEKAQFAEFKQYTEQSEKTKDLQQKKAEVFTEKTKEVFGDDFKGFEFKINDDKTLVLTPASANEIMQTNSSPFNLIGKFLDKDGYMKDAKGYHKALATAAYAEKLIKMAYEQGASDATENVLKEQKNINMGERKAANIIPKQGFKVEMLTPSENGEFKIQLPKNKT